MLRRKIDLIRALAPLKITYLHKKIPNKFTIESHLSIEGDELVIKNFIELKVFSKKVFMENYESFYDLSSGELKTKTLNGESLALGKELDASLIPFLGHILNDGDEVSGLYLKKDEGVEFKYEGDRIKVNIKKVHLNLSYNNTGVLNLIEVDIPIYGQFIIKKIN